MYVYFTSLASDYKSTCTMEYFFQAFYFVVVIHRDTYPKLRVTAGHRTGYGGLSKDSNISISEASSFSGHAQIQILAGQDCFPSVHSNSQIISIMEMGP